MSSGSQEKQERHVALRKELVRELRQLNGLGAPFYRAAAASAGVTATDIEVMDILDSGGPTTAGQLAEYTGLTTGAIAGMLNRLEEAGLVRRERDPNDGRRVVVRLVLGEDEQHATGPVFDAMWRGWDELASSYDDEQLATLVDFLKRGNVLSRQEIVRLRGASVGDEGAQSAPLGDVENGRLIFPAGIAVLTLRAESGMAELYRANFDGPIPDVKVKDGVVTFRYPKRLWLLGSSVGKVEITLNNAIPWSIAVQGGASTITADLGNLALSGMEIKGGSSSIQLALPTPTSVVPVRISGGASVIDLRRPVGVPARVHLKGWALVATLDGQRHSNVGNDVWLRSEGYDATAPGYDIEIAGSASTISITAE